MTKNLHLFQSEISLNIGIKGVLCTCFFMRIKNGIELMFLIINIICSKNVPIIGAGIHMSV